MGYLIMSKLDFVLEDKYLQANFENGYVLIRDNNNCFDVLSYLRYDEYHYEYFEVGTFNSIYEALDASNDWCDKNRG